ncbi:DUF1684 domain-containing protein [Ferrimonas marina]|nr:DUF1684 domain-containing protein [Ferrimonas marina]
MRPRVARTVLGTLVLGSVALFWGCSQAMSPEQQAQAESWGQWRAEQEAQVKDPQRSFLNIRDAVYLRPQQQVGLDPSTPAAQIRWHKQASMPLTLHHNGQDASVEWGDQQRTLSAGETLALNDNLFVTVGTLYDQGLRAFVRDRHHPKVAEFEGFEFFDYNPDARVMAQFVAQTPEPVMFQTIQGLKNRFYRVGKVAFDWQGQAVTLSAYHSSGKAPYRSLLLFFKDASNGDTTYGGGRELVLELPDGVAQSFAIDFNYTINFYCARSTFWNCPVLKDPALTVAVEAGEQLPADY